MNADSSASEPKAKFQSPWANPRSIFAGCSFAAGWLTFYVAYLIVILTPGYPDDIAIEWYTVWIWESLATASVVCALACASFFFVRQVSSNYAYLALLCTFEFIWKFMFFVKFFGV